MEVGALTASMWAIAFVAIAFGALVQGTAGFGSAVVAAPILAMLDPHFVPGPMLVCGLTLGLSMTLRERSAMNVAGVGWALVGRLPGTAAGTAIVVVLSKRWIGVMLAVLVLVAVALSLAGPRFKPSGRALFAAGVAGGFMGTASSIGGPPMALVYQQARGPELRATLSGYFAIGTAVSIASLTAAGQFGVHEARWGLALLPALFAGLAASGPAARALDRGRTRGAVLVISTVSAAALLVQNLAVRG